MAGGYSSDDSYRENTPKQSHSVKKDIKNTTINSSQNTPTPGKNSKDKYSTDPNNFSIPEILCQCQQKCTERVTASLIQKVCMYFKGIQNRNSQYLYLSTLIQIKVKNITADEKTTKGKPFRKMGFRYFVPILTEDDLNRQVEERQHDHEKVKPITSSKKRKKKVVESFPIIKFPDWDHVEVCLGAFTTVHIISEKRVTITRATWKLQMEMKCSKPFPSNVQGIHTIQAPKKKLRLDEGLGEENGKKKRSLERSGPDVCRLAAEWLAKEAAEAQKPSFAINPKTLLPEGLVLPASVTCLPIFPQAGGRTPPARDHGRDIDLVDNFFSDQLWKPEYIGGVP